MSSTYRLKISLRNLSVKVWSVWTRGLLKNSVFRQYRRQITVRELFQCFRQTFLRPGRTLLLSGTALHSNDNVNKNIPTSHGNENISDEDLVTQTKEFDNVEELSAQTLFCGHCSKRLAISKQLPGVTYCQCKAPTSRNNEVDGWVPYMETEDVIIWRKEYKHGQGLYAYKVYGRFPEVQASDFAVVQVDGVYRREWDEAVASLRVVESDKGGCPGLAVLHWEVLWPKLFANRDYVYIRRHKEFEIPNKRYPHKDNIFTCPKHSAENNIVKKSETDPQKTPSEARIPSETATNTERPNVHSNAKRKAQEMEQSQALSTLEVSSSRSSKAYVIVSRSCTHPEVPESKHVIRVTEYWSNMVIKTIYGPDKAGMEFVLTYYDEPAVGGMPAGVAAWATGQAAPAYLARMRAAAGNYHQWRAKQDHYDPDFMQFDPELASNEATTDDNILNNELDMKSSQQGPDLNTVTNETYEKSTQTDKHIFYTIDSKDKAVNTIETTNIKHTKDPDDLRSEVLKPKHNIEETKEEERELKDEKEEIKNGADEKGDSKEQISEENDEKLPEDSQKKGTWWSYLYRFYYFV